MLSKEEIEKIAKLARIGLREENIEKYRKDLSAILDYFKKLAELDTENVEPIGHITGKINSVRLDIVDNCEEAKRQAILANAPEIKDDKYKVKSIL